MDYTYAKKNLIWIFLAGLGIQIVTSIITYVDQAISNPDLINILGKLLGIYSIHLAVIIGNIFPHNANGRSKQIQISCYTFNLAATLSTMWNLLLILRSLYFMVASFNKNIEDSIGAYTKYVMTISLSSSFLIVGVLSYFFRSRK